MFTELAALPLPVHISIALVLGLLVGSFLNVVIFRYPPLLKYQWTVQSQQWLEQEVSEAAPPPGIVKPASHCPACQTPIQAWQNIPVISWLLLGGKCATCKQSISVRYPFVELLCGLLSAAVVYKLGWSVQALAATGLTWVLLTLAFIDYDHKLLPDDIVLPTLWVGLTLSLVPVFATPRDAIIGALAGYLSLWIVFQLFKLATGKDGMGYGDFKLLALLGAWFGWQLLPQIILVSTLVGSIVGVSLIVLRRSNAGETIPFGPFIALAGWVAMLWGSDINLAYLRAVGL